MSFSHHLLFPSHFKKCVPSLKKLTRNLWSLDISIWVCIFTGSSNASNDSLFNAEIWKIRSIEHLAPLSPSESSEVWCVQSAPIIFSISLLIAPLQGHIIRKSQKFETNEGPCPSPHVQAVLKAYWPHLLEFLPFSPSLLPLPTLRLLSPLPWTPATNSLRTDFTASDLKALLCSFSSLPTAVKMTF